MRRVIFFAAFLISCSLCEINNYLLYVTESNGISNLNLYNFESGETKVLTSFQDEGKINSISSSDNKILFTRPSKIYNRKNSTLWIINKDGSGLIDLISDITDNETILHVSVSPDKKKIVFNKNSQKYPENYQIYIKDIETGDIQRLTNFDLRYRCLYPSFVSNEHIVFKVDDIESGFQDIFMINIDGSNLRNLTNFPSPNFPKIGKISVYKDKIIYGKQKFENGLYSNFGIYLFDILNNVEIPIFENLYYGNIPPSSQIDPQPIFISDEEIAFIGTQDGNFYDIYITHISSTNPYLFRLTYSQNSYLPYFFTISEPFFTLAYSYQNKIYIVNKEGNIILFNEGDSPLIDFNGNWIVYRNNGIKIRRINGGNEITIESDIAAKSPCFTTDGKWILYIKSNDIYAKRMDGLYETRLTNTPYIEKEEIVFSPDGTYLLFVGKINNKRYIFKVSIYLLENVIKSGGVINLTENTYDSYNPAISPDGNKIVFISTRNQIPEIWEMDKNGKFQKKIFFQKSPSYPSNLLFSPFKNEIYFLADFPRRIYKSDLTVDFPDIEIFLPGISVDGRFSIGKEQEGIIDVVREKVYDKYYPFIPLRYKIFVNINKKYPSSFILEEIVPKEWILKEIKINDESIPIGSFSIIENDNEKSIKIIFGTPGAHKVEDVIVKFEFDISNSQRNEYWLRGWVIDSEGRYISRGGSIFSIGEPTIPFDRNKDWFISDEELLEVIFYWANNYRLNGWPENIEKFDYYLLKIISFWKNINGYKFDIIESEKIGEVEWVER